MFGKTTYFLFGGCERNGMNFDDSALFQLKLRFFALDIFQDYGCGFCRGRFFEGGPSLTERKTPNGTPFAAATCATEPPSISPHIAPKFTAISSLSCLLAINLSPLAIVPRCIFSPEFMAILASFSEISSCVFMFITFMAVIYPRG